MTEPAVKPSAPEPEPAGHTFTVLKIEWVKRNGRWYALRTVRICGAERELLTRADFFERETALIVAALEHRARAQLHLMR